MIELKNIERSFDGKRVLHDISLKIPTNKTVIIMGRSGVGKSVLLKLILRILPLESGRIFIDGIDTTDFSEEQMLPVRKKIGMLFQGGALFDSMNVWQNLAYPLLEHTDMLTDEVNERITEMLNFIDMTGTKNKTPSELSGGMKKRVALARAMIMNPDYVFYDEPTTGLDPITSQKINDLIIRTKEEYNVTSIVVTHEISSALYVGDIFAFLHAGEILFYGTKEEILKSNIKVINQFLEDASWTTT